jgi:tetratricopeptide (TPR) repeat protein
MAQKLTKDNYLKAVDRHLQELERLNGQPERTKVASYVAIGNMHWEFGNFDDARPYFLNAAALSREASATPAPAVAYRLWKAGHIREMEEECRSVIAHYRGELPTLEACGSKSEEDRHKLMLAYLKLAEASFILRNYEMASEWAQKAKMQRSGKPGTSEALYRLAVGSKAMEREAFVGALRFLRSVVREWPTFASDPNVDLYRFALYLGHDHFGAVPEELAREELDPDKWDRFQAFVSSPRVGESGGA